MSLPTLYEYYTSGGITHGLSANQNYFTLNNKNVTIYGGAMHYFRVPREYWRDRLRKMRAAGLNTVETYVPWNLHEPEDGFFDFGQGGSDMEEFLRLEEFLKTAKEEDLFAVVRPGPYICSEWDFGGFPSWLLRKNDIKLRTSDGVYMESVRRYFNVLLKILALLQFTSGGPVIAFQVENEYGSTETRNFTPDKQYLRELNELFVQNGIRELLFTSDSPTMHGDKGSLPIFLQTANFASNPETEFNALKKYQSNKPSMAMEFWSGWFDHWSEKHHLRNNDDFRNTLNRILTYPASVNMYMFVGGTNWGFLNGANIADNSVDNKGYQPDTTSYDYDAPLSENGDYTEKYIIVKELLSRYTQVKTRIPETPSVHLRAAYASVKITHYMSLSELIDVAPYRFTRQNVMPMEYLPINNNSGQSYGYIVYRKTNLDIPGNSILKIGGRVCDTAMVLVNGILLSPPLKNSASLNKFGYWRLKNSELTLGSANLTGATLDIIVENWGRNNFGRLEQFKQLKGLWQDYVYLNENPLTNLELIPLEFKKSFTNNLINWHPVKLLWMPQPALYKGNLILTQKQDTYINLSKWTKGIVIVNGFVLGRYALIGPQQTLYLPAPLLKIGDNTLLIFEHFYPQRHIEFSKDPIYKTY